LPYLFEVEDCASRGGSQKIEGKLLSFFSDAHRVQSLWLKTKLKTLKEALAELSKREETTEDNIGFYCGEDESNRCNAVSTILPALIELTKGIKLMLLSN
jgi:hypothetical protein